MEKFQAVTKEDVIASLQKYFLPLFDSASSVAVVVTGPSRTQDISEGLTTAGFAVEHRTLEVEPDEEGSDDGSEGGSEGETEEDR